AFGQVMVRSAVGSTKAKAVSVVSSVAPKKTRQEATWMAVFRVRLSVMASPMVVLPFSATVAEPVRVPFTVTPPVWVVRPEPRKRSEERRVGEARTEGMEPAVRAKTVVRLEVTTLLARVVQEMYASGIT